MILGSLSMTKETGDAAHKQRIYSAYTRDFKEFTAPEKYIEREHHVIDTTIVEEAGVFYRFSKDETTKKVRMDRGTSLQGEFTEMDAETLNVLMGVEGPAAFSIGEEGEWCLMVDRFAEGLSKAWRVPPESWRTSRSCRNQQDYASPPAYI